MASVIEKVRQQEHLRETATEAAYQQLVRDSHAGIEVDPRKALEILEAAGRDSADLEEDCKLLDAREDCRKLAGEIPALQRKLAANKTALEQAKAALASAEREFRGIAEQVEADNARITRRLTECDKAAARLRTDPAVRDEDTYQALQSIARELGQLNRALAEAEQAARPEQISADRARDERRLTDELHQARNRGLRGRSKEEFEAQLSEIRARLDALPGKFAQRIEHRDQLRKRHAELAAREKELEAQAIDS